MEYYATTTLEDRLRRLAQIRKELQSLSELKEEEALLKEMIMFDMQATKSKRTEAVSGLYASRVERTDVRVTDQSKVEHWLTDNNFALDEYLRLDLARVTPLVKATIKETGEIPEGTEIVTNEYISIKSEAK